MLQALIEEAKALASKLTGGYTQPGVAAVDQHTVNKSDVDALHGLLARMEAALGLAAEETAGEPASGASTEAGASGMPVEGTGDQGNGASEGAAGSDAQSQLASGAAASADSSQTAETGSQEPPADGQGASEGGEAGSQPGTAS